MKITIEISAQKQTMKVEGRNWSEYRLPVNEHTSRIRSESIHDDWVEADPGCTGFHQLLQLAREVTVDR